MPICYFCKAEFKTYKHLSRHVKAKHSLTAEQYYSKFYYREGEGICNCGKFTKFIDIYNGYSKHCSCKCQAKYRITSDTYVNPFSKKDIQYKIRQTKLANNSLSNTNQIANKEQEVFSKYKQLLADKVEVISYANDIFTCKCKNCNSIFSTNYQNVYNRYVAKHIICTNCNPLVSGKSAAEIEIANFISNYSNNIKRNVRNILNNSELDIYLPDEKIAFEYDGLYWHSEEFKTNNYHLNKTEECKTHDIHLIHIFEDEWLYKQDIVKSRILSLLHKTNRVYARKCVLKEVSYEESNKFLDENHIQGQCNSKYRYGLYYNDELVSLMTFGKSRFANEFELIRFCNKKYITVVGGAGKLFSHFIKTHKNIDKIISYADRRWSQGDLYEKLGFSLKSITKPNYFYVQNGVRHNRINYQKHKLVKAGYDKTKSEHEIMLARKIYRIYDCGNLKYEYCINNI